MPTLQEDTQNKNCEPLIQTQDLPHYVVAGESLSNRDQEIAIHLSDCSDLEDIGGGTLDNRRETNNKLGLGEEDHDNLFGVLKSYKSEAAVYQCDTNSLGEGKKSVPNSSILTSNDKHSVVQQISSNSRSSTPTGNKTGKFGGGGTKSGAGGSAVNSFHI